LVRRIAASGRRRRATIRRAQPGPEVRRGQVERCCRCCLWGAVGNAIQATRGNLGGESVTRAYPRRISRGTSERRSLSSLACGIGRMSGTAKSVSATPNAAANLVRQPGCIGLRPRSTDEMSGTQTLDLAASSACVRPRPFRMFRSRVPGVSARYLLGLWRGMNGWFSLFSDSAIIASIWSNIFRAQGRTRLRIGVPIRGHQPSANWPDVPQTKPPTRRFTAGLSWAIPQPAPTGDVVHSVNVGHVRRAGSIPAS
jgi:hypothetical protein